MDVPSGDMDAVRNFLNENDHYARLTGIQLKHVEPGHAIATLQIGPDHWNSLNGTHGGVTFTLADVAFAAASNSHGQAAVSIASSISHVKAVSEGLLTATARELSRSRRVATYVVEVRNEIGEMVALFQGTVYRKDSPYPPLSNT